MDTERSKKSKISLQSILNEQLSREWQTEATDEFLIELGKIVASTDYAVCFYKDKNHPKFFHNREALLRAIRRQLPSQSKNTISVNRVEGLCDSWRNKWNAI